MKLTIEIPCNSGLEMEENLNIAIADLSEALKKKGFSKINLTAYNSDQDLKPIYEITIE